MPDDSSEHDNIAELKDFDAVKDISTLPSESFSSVLLPAATDELVAGVCVIVGQRSASSKNTHKSHGSDCSNSKYDFFINVPPLSLCSIIQAKN